VWRRKHEEVINLPLLEALPELKGQIFGDLLRGVYETGVPVVGRDVRAELDYGDGVMKSVFFNFVYTPMRNHRGEVEGVIVLARICGARATGGAAQPSREREPRER
jgi:hypothetical protein